ncbi:hypothetical protein [Stenotrophomonas sp. YIM B13575]|uniref:hypothetical protein n=1 Tax=Stenotrophomonas sp. YIM B13575 TaxID=3366314 RepID=UPI0032025EA4
MGKIFEQLTQFTAEANNVAEFLVLGLEVDVVGDEAREVLLSEWAEANGHSLRPLGERSRFQRLVEGEASCWLGHRHFKDLLHGIYGPDPQRSRSVAAELVASIGPADYQWADFAIDDWTFCDVLVVTQPLRGIVIAFLAED